MKVAILTLYGLFNFGNRLQNFALQELLNELKIETETIIFPEEKNSKTVEYYKLFFRKKLGHIVHLRRNRIFVLRDKKFEEFNNSYIRSNYYTDKSCVEISSKFDYFIVGSDQVWNPELLKSTNKYFLPFAEPEQRIAFAASFGVTKLAAKDYNYFQKNIRNFHKISVREDTGAELVEALSGKKVPVLLDPTLFISVHKWRMMAKYHPDTEKSYILMYFLNTPKPETVVWIKKIAQKRNLEIININDIKEKKHYISGPQEFIGYIDKANLICTDSFHGTVFSILLKKPFVVFKREYNVDMYSRLETLLHKFSLLDRQIAFIDDEAVFQCNFENNELVIQEERNKALTFLNSAFDKTNKEVIY